MANSAAAKMPQKAKGDGVFARIWRFMRESYVETRYKSAWPTWAELRQFTMVVIFAVAVVGLWMAALDLVFARFSAYLGR
jgi:preprotein translocase subunit SecE